MFKMVMLRCLFLFFLLDYTLSLTCLLYKNSTAVCYTYNGSLSLIEEKNYQSIENVVLLSDIGNYAELPFVSIGNVYTVRYTNGSAVFSKWIINDGQISDYNVMDRRMCQNKKSNLYYLFYSLILVPFLYMALKRQKGISGKF